MAVQDSYYSVSFSVCAGTKKEAFAVHKANTHYAGHVLPTEQSADRTGLIVAVLGQAEKIMRP